MNSNIEAKNETKATEQRVSPAPILLGALSMITYLIYCIVWDVGIMVACGYLVFWKDQSGWWFLLAMIIAGTSYQPATWRKLWMPDAPNAADQGAAE